METAKGIWALIQEQEPIVYTSSTKLDVNNFLKSIQEQSAPREYTVYVGGLTNKFMEAHATDNKELLAEANAELKTLQDNVYNKLSKLTNESLEDIIALCNKYHHKSMWTHGKEVWNISSKFVGDEDNDYDDRYEYTELWYESGHWFIVVEWTDGYDYKILSKDQISFKDIKTKYL